MYSYTKDDQKCGKTAKGIKKNIIKKDITHENYKNTLFNAEQMSHKMKTIRSENHQLGSYEINKVSLRCFDDKRYIHEDGIKSYAYGHKNTKMELQKNHYILNTNEDEILYHQEDVIQSVCKYDIHGV